MQIITKESKKEIKEHGSFAFPVNISLEKIQTYEHGTFLWHWHPINYNIKMHIFSKIKMYSFSNN